MTDTTPADETAAATDLPRPDPVLAALQERRARRKADVAHAEVQLATLHAEQDRVTAVALEARALLDDVDAALARLEATARLAHTDARLAALDEPDLVGQVVDTLPDLFRELSTRKLAGAVIRSPAGSILTGMVAAPWGSRTLSESAFPCTVLAVW